MDFGRIGTDSNPAHQARRGPNDSTGRSFGAFEPGYHRGSAGSFPSASFLAGAPARRERFAIEVRETRMVSDAMDPRKRKVCMVTYQESPGLAAHVQRRRLARGERASTSSRCASVARRRAKNNTRPTLSAERLREELLAPVAHRYVVLTIPRLLRPLSRRRRDLLIDLARAGAEATLEFVRRAGRASSPRSTKWTLLSAPAVARRCR